MEIKTKMDGNKEGAGEGGGDGAGSRRVIRSGGGEARGERPAEGVK